MIIYLYLDEKAQTLHVLIKDSCNLCEWVYIQATVLKMSLYV